MKLIPDTINFKEYLDYAEGSEKVVPASTFLDAVIDRIHGESANNSPVTPWPRIGDNFQMRPGEVTLWAGINGHGKTLVTSQVALHLMVQNKKVCIASFEMKAEATMARMVKQSAASGLPQHEYIKRFHLWTDNLLWIYDQQGIVDPDTLRGVMLYARNKLGIEHFFIDSMMKVVRGDDDYNGQKDFVNSVCAIAQDTGMHVHLIAHVRKREDEFSMPNKFDVKGSGSITDLVDNVCIVWRNRSKERKLMDKQLSAVEMEETKKLPDCVLQWGKQRHFEWEGKAALWLTQGAQSFADQQGVSPYRWEPPARVKPMPSLIVEDLGDEVFD